MMDKTLIPIRISSCSYKSNVLRKSKEKELIYIYIYTHSENLKPMELQPFPTSIDLISYSLRSLYLHSSRKFVRNLLFLCTPSKINFEYTQSLYYLFINSALCCLLDELQQQSKHSDETDFCLFKKKCKHKLDMENLVRCMRVFQSFIKGNLRLNDYSAYKTPCKPYKLTANIYCCHWVVKNCPFTSAQTTIHFVWFGTKQHIHIMHSRIRHELEYVYYKDTAV